MRSRVAITITERQKLQPYLYDCRLAGYTRPASYQYYCSGLVSGSHTHTHSHKDMASAHTLREFFSKFFQHISGSASHESVEERNYRPKAGLNISLSFSVSRTLEWGALVPHTLCNGVKDGQVCASGGDSSVEWLTSQRTLSDRLFLTIMLSWPICVAQHRLYNHITFLLNWIFKGIQLYYLNDHIKQMCKNNSNNTTKNGKKYISYIQ